MTAQKEIFQERKKLFGRVTLRSSYTCHVSVCSLVLCLVTTKNWSDGHWSPRRVTALGSWTNCAIALRQISVTALFYLEDSRRIHPRSVRACQHKDSKRREWRSVWGGREGGGESTHARMHARTREIESERKRFGSSFYMFFSTTWACPMQMGLSQECCLFCLFCLKSSLWSSDLPCLLATAILDYFSLFYLPNNIHLSLSSLTMISSMSIHVAANGNILFFL